MKNQNQCEYCGKGLPRDAGFYASSIYGGNDTRVCCDAVCCDELLARDKQELATPRFERLNELVVLFIEGASSNGQVTIEQAINAGFSFDEAIEHSPEAARIAQKQLVRQINPDIAVSPQPTPKTISVQRGARLIEKILPNQQNVYEVLEAQGMSEREIDQHLPEMIAIAADRFAASLPITQVHAQ